MNKEIFGFNYNNTQLPTKESYAQDFWGYYNGQNNNKSLIPNPHRFGYNLKTASGIVINNDNNKSANFVYAKAGILEKITYPTGGSVCFDYELNKFNTYWVPDIDSLNNKISKGNGLRIRNIKYRDESNNIVKETKYEYSIGKSMVKLEFIKQLNKKYMHPDNTSYPFFVDHFEYLFCSSSPFATSSSLAPMSGIGYDVVTKYNIDRTGESFQGKIVTEYFNYPYKQFFSPENVSGTVISLPTSKFLSVPENGLIKTIKFYDKDNNPIKESSYEYTTLKSNIYYGAKISRYTSYVLTTIRVEEIRECFSQWLVSFYTIADKECIKNKAVEKEYFGNDSVVTIIDYTYDNLNRMISISKNLSETGNFEKKEYTYPTSGELYNKGRLLDLLSIKTSKINPEKTELLSTQLMDYITYNNMLLLGKITTMMNNNTIDFTEYQKYDYKGNLTQKMEYDGSITSYLWGYQMQYPIAVVENATMDVLWYVIGNELNDVAEKPEPTAADWAKLNNLRVQLPGSMVTVYKHKPLVGITEMTDPRGVTTYYNYDFMGRLYETYVIEGGKKKIIRKYNYHFYNEK